MPKLQLKATYAHLTFFFEIRNRGQMISVEVRSNYYLTRKKTIKHQFGLRGLNSYPIVIKLDIHVLKTEMTSCINDDNPV